VTVIRQPILNFASAKNLLLNLATGGHYGLHIFFTKNVYTYLPEGLLSKLLSHHKDKM